jgi:hypothetical protein
MKDLAPDILRQRLLVEGFYTKEVGRDEVEEYLTGVARHLGLRTYAPPIIHSPGGQGREINQGYDAFMPLIDSGIALYVWTGRRFFSTVIYTCKRFDVQEALRFTRGFFGTAEVEHTEF